MTDMKRTTVSLSDEIVERISRLRSTGKYKDCSYSEIIRQLILAGLPSIDEIRKESPEKGT